MERKILDVLRKMQELLSEEQLKELQNTLNMVFAGCKIAEETGLRVAERRWEEDLEDFLVSKALEGRSAETVKRYRYEINRLLSYIDKAIADIRPGGHQRIYEDV